MIAAVYEYAESGGTIPKELEQARLVSRFGVEAVFGRPLYTKEMRRMVAADNIYSAFTSRKNSKDWGKWASENPELDEILRYAMKASINGE